MRSDQTIHVDRPDDGSTLEVTGAEPETRLEATTVAVMAGLTDAAIAIHPQRDRLLELRDAGGGRLPTRIDTDLAAGLVRVLADVDGSEVLVLDLTVEELAGVIAEVGDRVERRAVVAE